MLADAERLHRTVDQVLRAGAISQKPKVVARAPVDMSELAHECVQLAVARHHLQADAIALESHDAGPLIVRGDAEELRTVVTNLLDNAVKYSSDAVRVNVAVAAPSPDTVWVRVQDRGVGIPRKQLKRIFRRFYRVQTRGLKHVKGTGLGLYIVRSIARAHGGRVFAQSEGEGRGATFTLELPRAGIRDPGSGIRVPSPESRVPGAS
jgi:signal transduction histidine kinase